MDLPGHSIPYALTAAEKEQFLTENAGNATLQAYLMTADPPYGIVLNLGYGQILVWYDQGYTQGVDPLQHLHVIDVTNMSIAREVQKAPFESPDSSFVQNLIDALGNLARQTAGGLADVAVIALLVGAFFLWKKVR